MLLRTDAFSPDRTRAVVFRAGAPAELWNARTNTKIADLAGQVISAGFSANSAVLLTIATDRIVDLWNAETGESLGTLKGHERPIKSATFDTDGKRVLTTAGGVDALDAIDNTARIWDIAGNEQIGLLHGHQAPVLDGAFSPNGRRLVTASSDRTARIWDGQSLQQLAVLPHRDDVLKATFVDENRVITASSDGIVRVWDADTGELAMELEQHKVPDELMAIGNQRCVNLTNSSRDVNEVRLRAECAKQIAPRCLTRGELEGAFLNVTPPAWCVRMGKWPYHTEEWKLWLKHREENSEPPLPGSRAWPAWIAQPASSK